MAKVQAASTQQHVPIAGVRNGIIILKDSSYRLILSVSPINFSLKSEQEQNSIIFKYQSFLNSLHFPIQVTMQSKKLDLTPYLQKMRKGLEKQENELIRMQTEDYIDFVSQLINIANIMSKSFFVTISHIPLSLPKLSFFDKLMGRSHQSSVLRISDTDFKANSEELLEKGNLIASGLGSIGLRVRQLTTQEVLEMFYNLYNPEESGKERLINIDEMQSSVVIDKNEATAAVAGNIQEPDQPKIDNLATVEAAKKQQIQERDVATQVDKDQAKVAPQEKTAPAPMAPAKAEPAPPIQQRLQGQPADSTVPQSNPIPPTPTPTATTQGPAPTMQGDNVQIK